MKILKVTIVCFFMCMALAACGGGGGGGTRQPVPRPPVVDPPVRPVEPTEPGPIPGAGELFQGETELESKLAGATLSGKALVVDPTYGTNNDEHYDIVVKVMTDIGVPAGNIRGDYNLATDHLELPAANWGINQLLGREYAAVRQDLKVLVIPTTEQFSNPGNAETIGQLNFVFVTSAGNVDTWTNGRDHFFVPLPLRRCGPRRGEGRHSRACTDRKGPRLFPRRVRRVSSRLPVVLLTARASS